MDYDDDMPMTTLNSVANAILPLVLSLLPPVITFYDSVSKYFDFTEKMYVWNPRWTQFYFFLQKGNVLNEVPLNSTYWAPVDAHDPVRVQQIMLGLTKTSAEKMDLALARDTKICESFIWLLILNQVAKKSEIVQSGIRNFFGFCNK